MYSLRSVTTKAALRNAIVSKLLTNPKSNTNLFELSVGVRRDFIYYSGFAELKKSQDKVIDSEKKFFEIQKQRNKCQESLFEIQNQLKEIHSQLPTLQRGDESYLTLVDKEYEAFKSEKDLLRRLKEFEKAENEQFALYTTALWESHRRQKARAEKAKNWPFLASAIGAALGILGTTLFFRFASEEQTDPVELDGEAKSILDQLYRIAQTQYERTSLFLSDLQEILINSDVKVKPPLKLDEEDTNVHVDKAIHFDSIKKRQTTLDKDLELVTKLLLAAKESKDPVGSVHVGPEVSEMLGELDEWGIKKDALIHVCAASGVGFLTFAILYFVLKSVT